MRVDGTKGLPSRLIKNLFEIPLRFLDKPLQSLGANVSPWRH